MSAWQEGEDLMAAATKKANSKPGLFGMFSDPNAKFEAAIEMVEQAANVFKMNKKWDRASAAYMMTAGFYEQLKVPHEAATCYTNAAKMMKKVDVKGSIVPLEKAATTYAKTSKFNFASKYSMEIAEILENDVADLDAAMAMYEQASDYAQMDGQAGSQLSKCNTKVARLAAVLEKYDRAIELFEEIADAYVENDLLKFSCKEFYLKAGLCTLCAGDVEGAKIKVERYEDRAAYFRDSREAKLLKDVSAAVENEDPDLFTEIIREYDAVSKLDSWMTQILLKIKKQASSDDLL